MFRSLVSCSIVCLADHAVCTHGKRSPGGHLEYLLINALFTRGPAKVRQFTREIVVVG